KPAPAVGVLHARFGGRTTDRVGAFADRQDGVVARVGGAVGADQVGEPAYVVRDLGNERAIRARQVRGEQRCLTTMTSEKLADRDPFVRTGGRSYLVNELPAARHGG